MLGGLASHSGTDKPLSIRDHPRSKTAAFQKDPSGPKLLPLVNTCLLPSKDETTSDGDSLEAESTAREESSPNGATLSMYDGELDHLPQTRGSAGGGDFILDQPEEDEDMDDGVLDEGHETLANFQIWFFAVL